MSRIGSQSWVFQNPVYIKGAGTVAGPEEGKGPLSGCFDKSYDKLRCGEKTWELAERKLMREAIDVCFQKAGLSKNQVNYFLGGDLLDQTVTANFIAAELGVPFLGMFGACSTSMETLALGAQLVDSGAADYVLTAVSSHNATAERQFRYPTEYGGPKPKTAEFTVTGSAASILSRDPAPVRVAGATVGKVQDWGINDANDMGSAMAPAAADTIETHFADFNRSPEDYDLIVTGDLSGVGSPILKQLLWEKGFDLSSVHRDCGLMIFSPDQPVFAGGSGCACSALVTYGHLMKQLAEGQLNRILVVATGALLNPTIILQKGETIPGIAHGVILERGESA